MNGRRVSCLILAIAALFLRQIAEVLSASSIEMRNGDEQSARQSQSRHATSKYSNLVPKHPLTSTSILYGRMKVLNWYLVRRKNKELGALRYGLNNDDMHITIQVYVNSLRTHIPVQKTYLHERQGKARKIRRKYLHWAWRRWRYLLSAKERMPILVEDKDLLVMPVDPLERVYSYAVRIVEIPDVFYLEQVHCMYMGIRPFITGILVSYSLQDLIGASLYSVGSDKSFQEYLCLHAINMWSDDQIVPNSDAICSRARKCHENGEFKDKKLKSLVNKYAGEIDDIYENKRFIGADSGRAYAVKAFHEMTMAFHELEAHKRPDYIEKLFVILRAIRFMIYANELMIRSGVKKKPVFKVEGVSDVMQYSVFRVEPVSMIRFCVAHFLTTRYKFRKNMGIAVIEEACVHSLSFGFIDDTGKLPPGVTRAQAREKIQRHFTDFDDESSEDFVVIKSHDQKISVDEHGNIKKTSPKVLENEEIHEQEEDEIEESDEEETWDSFIKEQI
ncbi:putative Secreted Protein (WYLE family) [Cryptosporidium felis]|nr:putative Secreted Protein (WYLE family) [Cryptosporidium felis]